MELPKPSSAVGLPNRNPSSLVAAPRSSRAGNWSALLPKMKSSSARSATRTSVSRMESASESWIVVLVPSSLDTAWTSARLPKPKDDRSMTSSVAAPAVKSLIRPPVPIPVLTVNRSSPAPPATWASRPSVKLSANAEPMAFSTDATVSVLPKPSFVRVWAAISKTTPSVAAVKSSRSLPSPPLMSSLPSSARSRSSPAPPSSESFPAPPLSVSLPSPPNRLSAPAAPLMLSAPVPPTMTLACASPASVSSKSEPRTFSIPDRVSVDSLASSAVPAARSTFTPARSAV